jgi:glutamine amidotransferase
MSLVIIDYGSGNLRSVAKAFARAAAELGRGDEIMVTGDAEQVLRAGRIVLPGVGAFADCMRGLEALPGMRQALQRRVIEQGRPFLGICVGMQLMAAFGREHGEHQGLDWLGGEVVALSPADPRLKVPHMGWNQLEFRRPHPLLTGITNSSHAYFVHSFHYRPANDSDVVAATDYAGPVAALVGRDNLAGTQFHPEKSQAVGLRLIGNFLEWQP